MKTPRARLLLLPMLAAALLAQAGPARARDRMVLGGAVTSTYFYGGQEQDSVLSEGGAHQARLVVSGLLGFSRLRPGSTNRLSLMAGARLGLQTATAGQGQTDAEVWPVLLLEWEQAHALGRRAELGLSVFADLEPQSGGGASSSGLAGSPTATLRPALTLGWEAARDHWLHSTLSADYYYVLTRATMPVEDVAIALGLELEAGMDHWLGRHHGLRWRVLGRFLETDSEGSPQGGVAGFLAGWTLRWRERLTAHATAGVARALGPDTGHLWAVEPTLDLGLAYVGRLDSVEAAARWWIREYVYVGGRPARFATARLRWTRGPSHRAWRGLAELNYEHVRFWEADRAATDGWVGATQHTISARARVYLRLGGTLRLMGEVAASYALLDTPTPGRPDSGLSATGLVGLAFVSLRRPRDEQILGEVW